MPGVPEHTALGKTLYRVSAKPWKVVGADIFITDNENLLYIIYYYSKSPVVQKVESLLAEDLIQSTKVVVAEYGLPKKLMSDTDMTFVSEQFIAFCRHLNTDQVVTLSYYHQCNGQVEACIKFVKCTIKKCRLIMMFILLFFR